MYEKEVEFMTKLGVVYSDANLGYQLDKGITRGETAYVLQHMLNAEDVAGARLFKDVYPDNQWYKNITFARQAGYMIGDPSGMFFPDDEVTLEEYTKVMVGALGYTIKAEGLGGYPVGYMTVAKQLDLFDGVNTSAALNKATAIKIAHNAVHADIMEKTVYSNPDSEYAVEKGVNILSSNFDIYMGYGVVQAEAGLSILDEQYEENIFIVNGETFELTDEYLPGHLGFNVRYYYIKDDSVKYNTIFHVENYGKNSIEYINFDDVISFQDMVYAVYIGDKRHEIDLDLSCAVVYNGIRMSRYDESLFLKFNDKNIDYGKLTFIDNDDNGEYDVLLIDAYQNFVVSGVAIDEKVVVYGEQSSLRKVDFEEYNVVRLKNKDGFTEKAEDLVQGDLLAIASSVDNKMLTIVKGKTEITGKITFVKPDGQDSKITIGEESYRISNNVLNTPEVSLTPGVEGTFFIDLNGQIAYYNSGVTYPAKIGYFVKAVTDEGFTKTTQVKIFESTGVFTIYELAEKITLNDTERFLSENINDQTQGGIAPCQIITYNVNSKGLVDEIYTPFTGQLGDNKLEKQLYTYYGTPEGSNGDGYKSGEMTFAGKVNINNNTVAFLIPADKTQENRFYIKKQDYFQNDFPYQFKSYGFADDGIIADVLVQESNVVQSGITYDTRLSLITDVYETITEDEEIVTAVTYRSGSTMTQGQFTSETIVTECPYGVNIGDIVQIVANGTEITEIATVYSNKTKEMVNAKTGDRGASARLYNWSVIARKDNIIRVTNENLANYTSAENIAVTDANVYVVKDNNGMLSVEGGSVNDMLDYKNYGEEYTQLLIYQRYGNPNLFVIYE